MRLTTAMRGMPANKFFDERKAVRIAWHFTTLCIKHLRSLSFSSALPLPLSVYHSFISQFNEHILSIKISFEPTKCFRSHCPFDRQERKKNSPLAGISVLTNPLKCAYKAFSGTSIFSRNEKWTKNAIKFIEDPGNDFIFHCILYMKAN